MYKLSFPLRRRVLLKLNAALAANGGFVTGFYTSNHGHVMKRIRKDLIIEEGVVGVPDDHAELFAATAKKLNEAVAGPGMSDVINELLFDPVATPAFFCPGPSFRIVYDPREPEEDKAVKNWNERLMGAAMNSDKLPTNSKFLGFEIGKHSHQEFGLQIADLVAGEVRRFFRFNPDLLTHGSGLGLITSEHQEGEVAMVEEIDGVPHKRGRQVPIPKFLLKNALRADENCGFAYLRNLLGSGLVTCITDFGTERDIALFDGCFLDLCD